MNLIFRYDDFACDFNRQSYAVCEQLFKLFLSLNIPMVVGVIPNVSAEIWNRHNAIFYPIEKDGRSLHLLKNGLEKGFQLALHGLTHQTYSDVTKTEYANRPYQSQVDSIKKGMNHLSCVFPNTPLDVFIPPWNSFDPLTVEAAGAAGISTVCAGENIKAYRQKGVLVVPSWPLRGLINYVDYYSLDNLAGLVGDSSLIITMHSYEFGETELEDTVSLNKLSWLLREIRMRRIGVGTLPINAQPIGFTPNQECLVRARLDLLRRGVIGRITLRAGHGVKSILGRRIAEKTVDTTAFGLQAAKYMYNRTKTKRQKVLGSRSV